MKIQSKPSTKKAAKKFSSQKHPQFLEIPSQNKDVVFSKPLQPGIFSCQRTFQRCRACLPEKILVEKARKGERQLRLLPSSNVIVQRFSIFRLARPTVSPSCSPSSVPKLARSWFSTSAHVRSCVDILVSARKRLYMERVPRRARVPVVLLFWPVLVTLVPYFLAVNHGIYIYNRGKKKEEDWKGKGHLCFYNYILIIILL